MKRASQFIITKFRISLQRVAFDGIGLTIILSFLLLIIVTNTIKVIQNGQNNYNIYNIEQLSLESTEQKNALLQREKNIVISDEYQKLLAREVLEITEKDENLYVLEDQFDFFQLEKKYIDLREKETYEDWWVTLIN